MENITTLNFCKNNIGKWEKEVVESLEGERLLKHQKFHFEEDYNGANLLSKEFSKLQQIFNYKSGLFDSNEDKI